MRCEDPDATVRDVTLARGLTLLACTVTCFACINAVIDIVHVNGLPTAAVVQIALVLWTVVLLVIGKYRVRSVRRSSMNTRPARCPAQFNLCSP